MDSRPRRHELVISQYMVIPKFKLNYNYLGIKNVSHIFISIGSSKLFSKSDYFSAFTKPSIYNK